MLEKLLNEMKPYDEVSSKDLFIAELNQSYTLKDQLEQDLVKNPDFVKLTESEGIYFIYSAPKGLCKRPRVCIELCGQDRKPTFSMFYV